MNVYRHTIVTPDDNVNLLSSSERISLFFSNSDESITVNFTPDHLPVLKNLVSSLEDIELAHRKFLIAELQQKIANIQTN